MKKFLKIFVPILLAICIIVGLGWYLFAYDREFTRDMLLHGARYFEQEGELGVASWFYDRAYDLGNGADDISIELARQYIDNGNYTQAEVTLNRAIRDGAGSSVYAALCRVYVEQDKLMDAIDLLDKISDPVIKSEIDALRPAVPSTTQATGFYNQYISVTVVSDAAALFVNPDGQYPSVHKDLYESPIELHDGENVLYAIAISDVGIVSPVAIFGYTVGGIVEEITFQDDVMEQTIRGILNVPAEKTLHSNDLWSITQFDMPAGVSDYSALRYMAFLEELTINHGVKGQLEHIAKLTCLRSLSISNTVVTAEEIALIGQLTTLESLTLNNCMLSSITGLSSLTELTSLDLGSNAIRNLSEISSLTSLKELNLSHNALQDLSALTSCSMLQVLDISYNSVTTMHAVTGLPLLTKLNISNNQIADISSVAKLSSLSDFNASHNSIVDISAIAEADSLSSLDISYNAIESLEALKSLRSLTYLYFTNNQVAELPVWSKSSKLVTIDGSYNQITSLAPLAGLSCLNNVYMDYNEAINSVEELAQCPVLVQVNVYGTKVKDVTVLTEQSIIVNYNPIQE